MSEPAIARQRPWERLDELGEYRTLCRARLEHVVPVREPLVLVSQIQRSGGTLLSQLFDGHPECHAHPHELSMRYLNKPRRNPVDCASAERSFAVLHEARTAKHLRSGYRKPAARTEDESPDVFPFLFLPSLQREIFEHCFGAGVESERAVLDCYFTSYFNAWVDNQNLYGRPKRIVTAFAPRLNRKEATVERLFSAYPDGFLVSIVRDPRAWFASARTQKARHGDVDAAIGRWRRSTEASLAARERHGERVVLLTYEALVLDTERTMRDLAERLGITMSPVLLTPTFNGRPIRANSSFRVQQHGVLSDRARAYRASLDEPTTERVAELAGDLYERARAVAVAVH